MAKADLEVVQEAWSAVQARDLDRFLSLVHDDVEFNSLIAEAEGGSYRGHDGVRAWWAGVRESLGTIGYEIHEMRDLGDGVVAISFIATGTVAGVEVPQEMWQVVRVRDGKAAWWGVFRTEDEAMAAIRQRPIRE